MFAVVYHGPGDKAWEAVADPVIIDDTDAIVRIDAVTICGTDLHILKGDVPAVTDGRILGHEAVGTVEEVGAGVKNVKVGDHVLVSCITACGACRYCRVGTDGALFHANLAGALESVEAVFRKGQRTAAYSGFEGFTVEAAHRQGLAAWLRDRAIEEVDVVGIATDYCVRATALDALDERFLTRVLVDLTAGVAPASSNQALRDLAAAGVTLL